MPHCSAPLARLAWCLVGTLIACAIAACSAPSAPPSIPGASIAEIRARGVLRVGLRQDLPRFAYLEPMTNRWDGFEVALARELAAALLGSADQLELVRVTDTQRVPYLRDGSVDIVVAQLTRGTSAEIATSSPYFVSGIGVLVPRERSGASLQELTASPVCAVKRSAALDALRTAAPSADTVLVDAPTECLLALGAGRAGAMAGDLPSLVRLALEDPSTAILPTLLREQPLVVGIPLGQSDLLDAVNLALAALRQNGRWTALHRQYFEGLLPAAQPPT